MVNAAQERIDAAPTAVPVAPAADPAPTNDLPRDLLQEVSWVDRVPAPTSVPDPAPVTPAPAPVAAAPSAPAPVAAAPSAPAVAPRIEVGTASTGAGISRSAAPHARLTPATVPQSVGTGSQRTVSLTPSPLAETPLAETPLAPAPSSQAPRAQTATMPSPSEITDEVEALRWQDLDQGAASAEPVRPTASSRPKQRGAAFLREWVPVALGALIVAIVLRTFVVQAFEIPSESMLPTLEIDDRIVVNQLSYSFGDISRGEVVVFERPPTLPARESDADYLVKRVIGLPGDTVEIRNGQVLINNRQLDEPYLTEGTETRPQNVLIPGCDGGGSATVCVVPQGFVFVFGDNRTNSTDSRVAGPIEADLIVGRAVVRAWPLNALSWL